MSEEQQFQGERWTNQTKNILRKLGWGQKGDSNIDIPCSQKSTHGKGGKKRINPHGIDLLFSYFDPYKSADNTVLVESKNRNWAGITTSTLQEFVSQISNTVECARTSSSLIQDLKCSVINDGLLMVWCNETDKFDENTFKEYVRNLKVKKRKNPLNIHIASNKEILRWCSIIQKVEEIKKKYTEFDFFYPSDYFSSGQTTVRRQKQLNLSHMFSDYIFAKGEQSVEFGSTTLTEHVNHIFFFAEPTIEELEFMDNCITRYQFEDANRLVIHIHGGKSEYRAQINQFKTEKQESLIKRKSKLKIDIDYLVEFKEVPENFTHEE
ncbi:hypothetical protein P8868_17005 [Bacillus inaquosorum]|uniref:hypothetical protein n=1 Tax=Bacillus inaquosorum TaxID=483913 RepID=UPI00227EB6EB|nr:hypothetical protein [Bacillus inaquosorum]MCY8373364.1 hypothetical protein [Bacillus inaquosorum]MEC0559254.1 hypothetical protein [Bacillus inaquosorum]